MSAAPATLAKVGIQEAKQTWIEFMTGQVKLDKLMEDCREGDGVCMVSPEGSQWTHASVRIVMDSMLMMIKTGKKYRLGILMNVHRFPVDDNNREQIYFGLQLYQNMFLDMHMWPFIDVIRVIQHLKPGQFSAGEGQVIRNSHYMLVVCSSDNVKALALSKAMSSGIIGSSRNPFIMAWGQHKVDQHYADSQWAEGKDIRHHTWKLVDCSFPLVELHADPKHMPLQIEIDELAVEGRLSMDIIEGYVSPSAVQMQELIKSYKVPQDLLDTTSVYIDSSSRRSYSNWHQDRCKGWDITVQGKGTEWSAVTMSRNSFAIALSIWEHFKEWKPLIGYRSMMNLDQACQGPYYFLVEFTFIETLQELTDQGVVAWTFLKGLKHAIISFCHTTEYGYPVKLTVDMVVANINAIRAFNKKKLDAKNTWQSQGRRQPLKLFINKMMCSKCPEVQELVQSAGLLLPDPDQRLIYDRHLEKGGGGRHSDQQDIAYATQASSLSPKHVQLTLTNFSAQSPENLAKLAVGIQKSMQRHLDEHAQLPNLPAGGSRKVTLQLRNHMTGILMADEEAVAEYFCKEIISQAFRLRGQGDRLAQINFASSHHHMLPSQLRDSMIRMSILDQEQAPGHEAAGVYAMNTNVM